MIKLWKKGKKGERKHPLRRAPVLKEMLMHKKRLTKRKPLQHPLVQKQVEYPNDADHKGETCAPSYLLC